SLPVSTLFPYTTLFRSLTTLVQNSSAQLLPFSTTTYLADGCCLYNGYIYFCEEKIMPKKDIVLPGAHNMENILAAIAAVKLKNVDRKSTRLNSSHVST